MEPPPDLDQQRDFWDGWNQTHRTSGIDDFMARQAQAASRVAAELSAGGQRRLRILEVGCGTGWLAAALTRFGDVTATDLSERSVEIGRDSYPEVHFVVGDFAAIELAGPYDLVVSADTIAHVADQAQFAARVADLLVPGGTFVLMTQNGFVWRRSSYLSPQGQGQLRSWPSLGDLRAMLEDGFRIRRVGSIVPGGDRGVLRLTRAMRGGARLVRIEPWMCSLQERARVGRELVVTATRRDPANVGRS